MIMFYKIPTTVPCTLKVINMVNLWHTKNSGVETALTPLITPNLSSGLY